MKPGQLFDPTMTLDIGIQERAKAAANNHLSGTVTASVTYGSPRAGRRGGEARTALQGSSFKCVLING